MNEWVPIKARKMSVEEKEQYKNLISSDNDVDGDHVYTCLLPKDTQKVLVTVNDFVEIDTFFRDPNGLVYFENNFIGDVKAWKVLPEPYKDE